MNAPSEARAVRPRPQTAAFVAGLTIVLIAVYRLVPHPWNVAPSGAMFVLGGFYLGRSWRGWAIPFAAMLTSDALIFWRLDHSFWPPERLIDYLAFALVGLLARALGGRPAARIGAVAAAPIVFYLVSNFGVWLLGGDYARTPQGLGDCYVAALPFLRGTLIGDWLFAATGILAIEGLPGLPRRASRGKAPASVALTP